MALTVPTIQEFEDFRNEPVVLAESGYIEDVLAQATDVVWIFTGIDADPTDTRMLRIMRYAIMDLTLWLLTQHDHRDEINSPFSSERIGSYSYSKMSQAKNDGDDTGIYWVDLLFRLLRSPDDLYSMSWVDSERVFNPSGKTFEEMEEDRVGTDYWPFEGETAVHIPETLSGGEP